MQMAFGPNYRGTHNVAKPKTESSKIHGPMLAGPKASQSALSTMEMLGTRTRAKGQSKFLGLNVMLNHRKFRQLKARIGDRGEISGGQESFRSIGDTHLQDL